MIFSTIALQYLGFGSGDDLGTVLGSDGCQSQHLSGGQQTLVTDGSSATGNILPAVTWCLGREGDGVDLGGWNQPTDVAYVGGTGALLGAEEVRHQEIVERYRSMLAYFVHIGGNLFAFVAGIAGQVVVWHLIGCDDLLVIPRQKPVRLRKRFCFALRFGGKEC